MENELAEFSILWRDVGSFHDLSKVLGAHTSDPSESYGNAWCMKHGSVESISEDSVKGIELNELCESVKENEMLAHLSRLRSHWDSILFDSERKLDNIASLRDSCIRGLTDLTLKEATYRLNFKHVDQKFNELSARKVALSEKIAMLEEMYSHYAHYKSYSRILDQIENNKFIKTAGASESEPAGDGSSESSKDDDDRILVRTLEYVDMIAEKLNNILPSIDASIDFFTIHHDYFESDVYRYKYETMRTRVFTLIKQIFKELYNFANESCRNHTQFDITEHYNKYRRIGRITRNLNRYYTTQETELSNAEFLQLQMYYIASRIKILNPLLLLKMESFNDFNSITSLFLLVCNLEILTFKETFVSDATYESLGTMVDNIAFYFVEACKKQMASLAASKDMRMAMHNLKGKLINPIRSSKNEAVLQPLLIKAQQIHQNMETTLLKSIQKEIAVNVRGYDKKPFLTALCSDEKFEFDREHESLQVLHDNEMLKAGLYPPICFAVAIVLANVGSLGTKHSNSIVTESVDAVKAALLDVQYAFGKQCKLAKPLVKINQDLFMMKNLQYVLNELVSFSELEAVRAVRKLYKNSEQQLCSSIVGVLMGDFQEFSRKQKKHKDALYKKCIEATVSQLEEKMPIIRLQLESQLLPDLFAQAMDNISSGLHEVVAQYSNRFSVPPPSLPDGLGTSSVAPPKGHLLQL
ncbi:hypothetical protein BgAZ_502420 [Babesia gibsoni]|uniref:Conserved oligomeric Golgi complex subunit 3 N-terminal domain-containing protein n=1 Tax=Babesia gibsoni TaxID=33632 RepID=A0AAD8LQX3_BABGI|nr:hypothetical protein BgAZ_502420 [Babesia gibsoni]